MQVVVNQGQGIVVPNVQAENSRDTAAMNSQDKK